jgi:Lhr-like helicase
MTWSRPPRCSWPCGEELDRIEIPETALDVLAQKIVAEVSAQEWNEDQFVSKAQGVLRRASLPHDFAGNRSTGVIDR